MINDARVYQKKKINNVLLNIELFIIFLQKVDVVIVQNLSLFLNIHL